MTSYTVPAVPQDSLCNILGTRITKHRPPHPGLGMRVFNVRGAEPLVNTPIRGRSIEVRIERAVSRWKVWISEWLLMLKIIIVLANRLNMNTLFALQHSQVKLMLLHNTLNQHFDRLHVHIHVYRKSIIIIQSLHCAGSQCGSLHLAESGNLFAGIRTCLGSQDSWTIFSIKVLTPH